MQKVEVFPDDEVVSRVESEAPGDRRCSGRRATRVRHCPARRRQEGHPAGVQPGYG